MRHYISTCFICLWLWSLLCKLVILKRYWKCPWGNKQSSVFLFSVLSNFKNKLYIQVMLFIVYQNVHLPSTWWVQFLTGILVLASILPSVIWPTFSMNRHVGAPGNVSYISRVWVLLGTLVSSQEMNEREWLWYIIVTMHYVILIQDGGAMVVCSGHSGFKMVLFLFLSLIF